MATKLENLKGKSEEIVEERSEIKEKRTINSSDRAIIKDLLSGQLRDDADLGLITQVDAALGEDKKSIDDAMAVNLKETKSAVDETDEYIQALESNLAKLDAIDKATDIKIGESKNQGETERRIEELQSIREMLTDESLDGERGDLSAGDYSTDFSSDREGFFDSLRVNIEQAKYQYCLGVLTKGDLPEGYDSIISDRHDNAEPDVRKVFDHFADQLVIKDANYPPGKTQHYTPSGVIGHTRGVYYNAAEDANNPRGNGTTYYHELAHMIDHASTGFSSNLSNTEEFRQALIADSNRILDAFNKCTPEQKYAFINSLRSNNRTHSFQDLLDATTGGVISAGWGHSREYWNRPGNLQAEAFAHFFEASMGAPDKLEMFNRYFPNAFAVFSDMIDSIKPNGYEKVLVRSR